ncbi:MAG: hypothetical protein WC863_02215 [Patescibacteria group bacterium]
MMNDKKFFANLDRGLIIEQNRQNAEVILKNPGKTRIKESDFKDIFDEKTITDDSNFVNRLQDKFDSQLRHLDSKSIEKIRDGEKRSEVLEIIIAVDGERYEWAGDKARLSRTSRFDDLANGVDIILEFIPGEENNNKNTADRLALGVDASSNGDTYALRENLERNIQKLSGQKNQKLPEVKYFQSAIDKSNRGQLKNVIPVVIGLDATHVNELMKICASLRNLTNIKSRESLKNLGADTETLQTELEEKLKNHPAQVVIYRQMVAQLTYYLKILKYTNNPVTDDYKLKINSILERLYRIKESKKNIPINNYADDEVLAAIEEVTSMSS